MDKRLILHSLKNTLTHVLAAAGLVSGLLISSAAHAINVSNANTVTEAQMQAALTGSGVTISNLTITNPGNCPNFRRGVGIFSNGTTAVGPGPVLSEPTGVVVANADFASGNRLNSSNNTDNATNILCNGTTSDADMLQLESLTNGGEYAAIEFDVVPQFTTLAIPFQFGSEEFPEYVCSNYTDIVGIFVSGPGINGVYSGGLNAENYAKTAAGDLTSINWINTGVVGRWGTISNCSGINGSLANAAFYTDNSNGDQFGGNATVATTNANLEVDGFTNKLYQPITVVAGSTYHVKIAVADAGDRFYDSAAFIHPLFSSGTFSGFDYGDAPNSYGTLTSSAGPSHGIDASIFMGTAPDSEITGIPSVGADGDDLNNINDEDGVAGFPALLSNASNYSVTVNVTNNSGNNARLVGWIDFNRNGIFESGEGTQTSVANGATGATMTLNWSGLSGLVGGTTYARLRFSSDIGLSIFTTGSSMADGEVEDYALSISTVNFTKYVSTDPNCADTIQTLTVAVGVNVYYCYTVNNPNTTAFAVTATADDQGHDISALQGTYAAGTSNTVIIGPLVSGGAELPTGVTTVNIAQITADIAGTPMTVSDSASLTVTIDPPANGVKQLYFDAVNTGIPDLTRDPTNALADTRSNNIAGGNSFTLNQGVAFASPFTFSGGNDVIAQVWVRRRNGGGSRTVQVELFNGNTGVQIGAANQSISWNANGWQSVQVPISIAADTTLATGDFIRVVLTNTSTNGRDIQIRTLRNGVKSQLQIQSSTVINVNNINVYDAAWPSTVQYSSYVPGSTVFIRALVSDPFGSADITSATLTIDDPNSPPSQVTNAAMALVDAPTTASRLFEYSYVIPVTPEGFWSLSATANEGFETTVSHTGTGTMIVGTANITISKNSAVLSDPINTTNPKAIPGAIVEYIINVSNAGYGYINTDSIVLTDPVAGGTTFFFGNPLEPITFTDGAVTSGLTFTFSGLASTTDDIDFSNDGGATFVTPTTDANGFDTTAPPINFIRINPKGEFKGGDTVNNPSMEIKFRVRVQ